MHRDLKQYKVLTAAAPRAIASTTNTSPIEVTMAAPHNYVSGDKVTIVGHATNTNANGSWVVQVTGASTLELIGSEGNGVGAGTGSLAPKAKVMLAADFKDSMLAFDTDGAGDADLTVKVVGSLQRTPPDFAKPQSADNQYDYLQMLSLSDSVEWDGATGIVLAAGDINRMFEVNINGVHWISVVLEGTEGELTVVANLLGGN